MNNLHTKNHRPLLKGCSWAWQHCLSHQVQKKNGGDSNRFVYDVPFIDERKPSSMTVAKGVSINGEHMLIPVTAKMIHSAVWDLERFVLKDDQPLHMVKLVGAVRKFCVNIKHVQIDLEDGTGLVRVILWRKKNALHSIA
jgi:hypothetical protein